MGKKILIGFIAVVAVLFMAKGVIAKVALSAGVKKAVGVRLEIDSLAVGVFRSRVHAQGIRLHNPSGFPDPVMADLPELYVDYNLPAFLQGKTHLRELRVHLREFLVVKDAQGRLNLDSLKPVKEAKEKKEQKKEPEPAKPGSFLIDDLNLKVEKVVYKDYSGGGAPTVQEFAVNLNERHRNVTDPSALGALIVSRALLHTTIASLANFDLRSLDDYGKSLLKFSGSTLTNIGGKAVGTATDTAGKAVDTAGKAVEGAVDSLNKLLPFGDGQPAPAEEKTQQ